MDLRSFADELVSASPSPSSAAFRREELNPSQQGIVATPFDLPAEFDLLESTIIGSDLTKWVGMSQLQCQLTLAFLDFVPRDGSGDDLVVFDIGNMESIAVEIGATTQTYSFQSSGTTVSLGASTAAVNYALIDLADFGVLEAPVVTLLATTSGQLDSDPAAVGALNFTVSSSCTFRNGSGINPIGFDCQTPPAIGTAWNTTIVTTSETVSTTVLVSLGSAQVPFLGGEILVALSPPPVALPGVMGLHTLPVPNQPGLLGAEYASQGFRIDLAGGSATLVMLNAQDLLIGN